MPPWVDGRTSWLPSQQSRVFPSGVRWEPFIAAGSRSRMAMWRRAYRSCAAARRLISPLGRRCGCPITPPSWLGACEIAGQIEESLTLLDNALQIVERTGERWFAAELNRHKGQLLERQGHSEAAEELYRKALDIAAEQGAKLWE